MKRIKITTEDYSWDAFAKPEIDKQITEGNSFDILLAWNDLTPDHFYSSDIYFKRYSSNNKKGVESIDFSIEKRNYNNKPFGMLLY